VSDIQPISKRSKRILEEAFRHLRFAHRGIALLSVAEYELLAQACLAQDPGDSLENRLDELVKLTLAVGHRVLERG